MAMSGCGSAICGPIARAFDEEGREITAPNVGKRVFRDLRPVGARHHERRAYAPAQDRTRDGDRGRSGDRPTVKGSLGAVCKSRDWRRWR
ncbi:MAG: hypothetical protein ACLFRZ_11895 [Rhodosalinus sp.]